jgi:imidazolonepropionase-like amidohydrolase
MPMLAPDVARELVSGAKNRGMKVYIHAWQMEYYRQALDMAPDAIIHPPMDAPLSPSDLEALKGVPWMTTMAQLFYFGDRQGYARRVVSDSRLTAGLPPATVASLEKEAATTAFPELVALVPAVARNFARHLETVRDNTRRAAAAGALLSIGSDRPVGHGTHVEIELIAEAGFAPPAILKAATAGGAAALGVSRDLGSIAPGKLADLVLLGSDPLRDVRNLRDVKFVMKAGRLWSDDELRTP